MRNTPPEVVSYSPVWNDGDDPVLCNTPVVINFNWDMDIPSTEAAFEISPAVEGSFTWEDTNYRLVFTPTDAYDVSYAPMHKSMASTFTTTSTSTTRTATNWAITAANSSVAILPRPTVLCACRWPTTSMWVRNIAST